MVVQHRSQQVVRGCDRVEVACEMQVHVFHRHNLRHAATGSPTLHTKVRPEGRLTDTDRSVFADPIQTIAQTHGCCGLALTCGRWVDGCDQYQLAVRAVLYGIDERLANFRFIVAIWQQIIAADAQLRANVLDRLFDSFASNLNVGFIGHGASLMRRRLPGLLNRL